MKKRSVVTADPRVHLPKLTGDINANNLTSQVHLGTPRQWLGPSGRRCVTVAANCELESVNSSGANVMRWAHRKHHVQHMCSMSVDPMDLSHRTSDKPPLIGDRQALSKDLATRAARRSKQNALEHSDIAKPLERSSRGPMVC